MPLIRQEELSKGLFLGVWHIDETLNELLSFLYLNKDEFEMLENFNSELRKKQWLSYRVLIRSILKEDLIYKLYYSSSGKPFLVQPSKDISVTHSGFYTAILISEPNKYRFGIDLEHISEKILRIRNRFLNPIECIRASINPTPHTYVQLWSSKESVYKCLEQTNISIRHNIFIHSIRIIDNNKKYFQIKAQVFIDTNKVEHYLVKSEYINQNYILSYTFRKLE